jgi:outer membrane protein TolC
MKYRILTALLLSAVFTSVQAQTSIERVLSEIERNHKILFAGKAYAEAKKLVYKTGLAPQDPTIGYDLLYGSPVEVGNQREFSIVQPLDFPTTYVTKIKRSKVHQALTDYELRLLRQSTLLQAKQTLIEWVYRTKLDSLLNDRKNDLLALVAFTQKSMEAGEGNRLEVNKARLKLLEERAAYDENKAELGQIQHKLQEMNGGHSISLAGVDYDPVAPLPEYDSMAQAYRNADLKLKYLEKEKQMSELNVVVAKSQVLPDIEVGYLDYTGLDQRFKGIHLGVSIPIWENKNIIKTQKAELLYRDAQVKAYETEQHSQLLQQYERLLFLGKTLRTYQQELSNVNHRELLNKSLVLGNTSILDYLSALDVYYDSMHRYLEVERSYQDALAAWMKYTL